MTDRMTPLDAAIAAAPCTARKPRSNAYDSGFFDATIAYQKALSALPAVGGWLDIATALEDGETILCYRPDAGVFTAHYVQEDTHLSNAMNPPEGDYYWFTTGGEDLTGDMPTH